MKIEIANACSGWTWVCWLDAHPGLAAWVQALGIVVTLLSAVVAAQLPIWNTARRERQKRISAILALIHGPLVGLSAGFSRLGEKLEQASKRGGPKFSCDPALREVSADADYLRAMADTFRGDHQIWPALFLALENANYAEWHLAKSATLSGSTAKNLALDFRNAEREIDGIGDFLLEALSSRKADYSDFLDENPWYEFGAAGKGPEVPETDLPSPFWRGIFGRKRVVPPKHHTTPPREAPSAPNRPNRNSMSAK